MVEFKIKKNNSAAFLDINIFAKEEFTSGLLITVREILNRLKKLNSRVSVLSVAQVSNSKKRKQGNKAGMSTKFIQGIPVKEVLVSDRYKDNTTIYINAVRMLLKESKPALLFMNTVAIFLDELHILTLQEAILCGSKVIMILVDALFPTYKTHKKKDVDRYYTLIRKTQIISTSKTLIDLFYKETGITAKHFPNLFTVENIISKKKSNTYITLVNHHPIKGREIFNAIADKMPDKKFLAVESWPDVPLYNLRPNNIVLSNFKKDARSIYNKTRILLIPSLCNEGPARVIIEALLNEIPVIAHRIGSIPEIGNKKIFLVDPPLIQGNKIVDTIVYPQVDINEVNIVSDNFAKLILEIDNNPLLLTQYTKSAKRYALDYCREAEKKFSIFAKNWLT